MTQLEFDTEIYNTIRTNIRKYRKLKRITSAELAEMVDLSHDFIRQIQSQKAGYNFSVEQYSTAERKAPPSGSVLSPAVWTNRIRP